MNIPDIMNEPRWDCSETFIATCKAFTGLREHLTHIGSMSLADVNLLQDLLIEQGFAIQKIIKHD